MQLDQKNTRTDYDFQQLPFCRRKMSHLAGCVGAFERIPPAGERPTGVVGWEGGGGEVGGRGWRWAGGIGRSPTHLPHTEGGGGGDRDALLSPFFVSVYILAIHILRPSNFTGRWMTVIRQSSKDFEAGRGNCLKNNLYWVTSDYGKRKRYRFDKHRDPLSIA